MSKYRGWHAECDRGTEAKQCSRKQRAGRGVASHTTRQGATYDKGESGLAILARVEEAAHDTACVTAAAPLGEAEPADGDGSVCAGALAIQVKIA
jgi:hypothetical protein